MRTTNPSADWVPLREAAEREGVNQVTIRRMIDRGEVQGKRFGDRLIRVNMASLEKAGRPMDARDLPEYIRRLVAEAPELTPAQRELIASILRGGHAKDGGGST